MKRRLKYLLVLILAAAMMIPAALASTSIKGYCIAIDEWIPDPLTADTMPINENGQIYLPQGLFTNSQSNLGVSFVYHDNNTLRLYRLTQLLTFDVSAGTATDQDGVVYQYQAIIRDGRAYFPAVKICSFFHFEYKYQFTAYADFPLIRIRTSRATVTSDVEFLNLASSSISDRRAKYLKLTEVDTTETEDVVNEVQPNSTRPEQPSVSTEEIAEQRSVYLSFETYTESSAAIASILMEQRISAIFLLTADEIIEQDDFVRMLIGQGQSIGLRLNDEDRTDAQEQLARVNEALEHIAFTRIFYVSGDVSAEQLSELVELGVYYWDGGQSVTQAGWTRSAQIVSGLDKTSGEAYLLFDMDETTLNMLTTFLQRLYSNESYHIAQPAF